MCLEEIRPFSLPAIVPLYVPFHRWERLASQQIAPSYVKSSLPDFGESDLGKPCRSKICRIDNSFGESIKRKEE